MKIFVVVGFVLTMALVANASDTIPVIVRPLLEVDEIVEGVKQESPVVSTVDGTEYQAFSVVKWLGENRLEKRVFQPFVRYESGLPIAMMDEYKRGIRLHFVEKTSSGWVSQNTYLLCGFEDLAKEQEQKVVRTENAAWNLLQRWVAKNNELDPVELLSKLSANPRNVGVVTLVHVKNGLSIDDMSDVKIAAYQTGLSKVISSKDAEEYVRRKAVRDMILSEFSDDEMHEKQAEVIVSAAVAILSDIPEVGDEEHPLATDALSLLRRVVDLSKSRMNEKTQTLIFDALGKIVDMEGEGIEEYQELAKSILKMINNSP